MASSRPVTIIGSKEFIDFPELDLEKVPAKVDTGADSSAIWASSIHATPEGLYFTLFGPGSRFYTGRSLIAHTHKSTQVKNSFGQAELRYKVRLVVRVEGRKIRGWFTLSDRSDMRYPVLLGRRLLKNKFVVDVGKSTPVVSAAPKLLILATSSEKTQRFVKDLQTRMSSGAEAVLCDYRDLTFRIEPANTSIQLPDHTDVSSFSMVYFKNHKAAYPLAISVAQYADFHNLPYIDRELAEHVSYDKLSEMIKLVAHGMPVVPCICADARRLTLAIDEAESSWGFPMVMKEINSTRGKANYLVSSRSEIEKILEHAEPRHIYMLQKYIENDGFLRLFVLGHEVAFGVFRSRVASENPQVSHLHKPAGGSNAALWDRENISSYVTSVAVRSAEILQRGICGVDLIQDKNSKEWYVLEANYAPQLVTGSHLSEKLGALAKYLDDELSD